MSDMDPLDERERMEPERETAPRASRVGVYDTGGTETDNPTGERTTSPVDTYDRTDTGTGGSNLLGLLLTVIVIILVVFLLVQFVL